jgi:hypothetical protein
LFDKVQELSDENQKLVGNISVKNALNWKDDKYSRVKDELIRDGLLVLGRGKGGSVRINGRAKDSPIRLFISYSHGDEIAKDELIKHLMPLKRAKLIRSWNDRMIMPGEKWDDEISAHLKKAEIIILIVSIEFINSDYCYDVELHEAMKRQEENKAIVIPVIYRNCVWQHAPFAELQALPKNAKPICSWNSQEDAFVDVVKGVEKAVSEILDPQK